MQLAVEARHMFMGNIGLQDLQNSMLISIYRYGRMS